MFPEGVEPGPVLSSQSERSGADAQTPLGVATQDVAGRVMASLGQGGPVDSHFAPCADVPKAGGLIALPALLASGLWEPKAGWDS